MPTALSEFELLTTPEQLGEKLKVVYHSSAQLHLMYAWAGSGDGRAHHWTSLPLHKVNRALIGIGFVGSEPHVLRELHHHSDLRIARTPDGTFHPKLLLGISGDRAWAIFGSSNFTTGGFQNNTELNAFIAGSIRSGPLRDALAFFEEHWERTPAELPDGWLDDYEDQFRSRPKPVRPPPLRTKRLARHRGLLDMTWAQFIGHINQEPDISDGISILDRSVKAFREHPRYDKNLDLEIRKNVAGWNDAVDGDGGWFGSMRAAGHFKSLCASSPEKLGKHLDQIPTAGNVPDSALRKYLDGILAVKYVGLSGATRLLLSKRPDLFLCVNKANVDWLVENTGITIQLTKTASATDQYVELLNYLRQCPWYRSPRPKNNWESRLWDGRMALVDRLAYSENQWPGRFND